MLKDLYLLEFYNIVLSTLWIVNVIVSGKIVNYQINRVL